MDGAVYALIVNSCVAVLFAATFAVLRASYPQHRATGWFCAAYALGIFSPLGGLAIRYSSTPSVFSVTSYIALVASLMCLTIGVSVLSEQKMPRWLLPAIVVPAALVRVSLYDHAWNTLAHGIVYQLPFFTLSFLCAAMATCKARRSPDMMWATTGVVFAITAAYFAIKPFVAAASGSGATMRDYATTSYALFSHALGGILTVATALMVLLKVMRAVLRSTRDEADTDMLTRVANRRGFERGAVRRIAAARRDGDRVAVLMLDLDHFKQVNDGFGHATGDMVLQAVAQAICAAAPADALVARLGGEEFVALFGGTTAQRAVLTGEAIRAAVADLGPHLPRTTISGGIAMLRPDDTLATLLDRADRRAYDAKAAGRDRIYPATSRDR